MTGVTNPLKAAINNTINFQSKIVDKTTGLNITSGTPACVKAGADTCDFQVRVWNDPSATSTTSGTGNLMFTQTFQDVEIGDTNGTFNLVINSCGSTTSGLSQWGTSTGTCTVVDDSDSDADAGVNFDRQDLYIEVGFAPTDTSGSLGSFTELFTRTGLKSVPSAFVAQTLSGIGASGFVQAAPSATQTITSTNSLINLTSTATGATNPLLVANENGSGTPDLIQLQVAGTPLFKVDNTGLLTSVGATIAGAAVNVNDSSNFAVNIGTGTSTGTVTLGGTGTQTIALGNGAGVKTVSLGSSNTTSTTTLLSGSGGVNINVSNNQPTNIGTGSTTGTVTLGGTGTQTIAVGNGAGVKTVQLGSSNTTSTTTILSGSGGLNLNVSNNQPTNIGTGTTTGTVTIGGNGTQTIAVGDGAGVKTVSLGSSNTTSTTTLLSGSGGLNLNVSNNQPTNIGTGTTTGTVTVGGTGTQTIAVGNGAGVKTVSLGSSNTTSTTTILSGSGGVLINNANSQPTTINGGGSTGTLTLGGGSGSVVVSATNWGVNSSGQGGFATTASTTANVVIGAATTGASALRLTTSAGTNPSSPTNGDLWWNGTNLNFRTASTTVDLLAGGSGSCAGCVSFAPAATQSTSSTNSLINITTTATAATNPLIIVNENGSGTPDLLQLQVAGTPLFKVDNLGATTATGGFSAPSGSVSAIPFAFSDDLSTGIYGDGAGKINFSSLSTTILSLNGTTSAGFNIGRVDFQPADVVTPSINFGDINTGIFKAGTNELGFTNSSSESLRLTAAGDAQFANNILAGTATNTAFLNVAPSTSGQASLRLVSSAATDPSSPNSGDFWWNGTNLNFRTASTTVDLLAGGGGGSYVNFIAGSTQTTTSTNSLVDLTTTATGATAALIKVNQNGSGTPDILDLQSASVTKLKLTSIGQLQITGDTNAENILNVNGSYNTGGGGNSVFQMSGTQTATSSGSMDVLNLFSTFSSTGTLAGMNGALIRAQSIGGGTITNASGVSVWGKAVGGSIDSYYGVNIYNAETGSGGTISNNYGVYVGNQTAGTNNYGLYLSGATNSTIYANTGAAATVGLQIQGVSSQTGNLLEVRNNSNVVIGAINSAGAFTASSSSTTRIQASGSTAGNTNNGSIYFLDSAGTTRGRLDTATTSGNRIDGDGADGAITVASSLSMNTAVIATGRVTYADGIAYRINPPASGDTSVTRYRSLDTISNGIVAGDEVMIINLQGATVVAASAPSYDTASVGNYEFKTVASVSASAITFTEPIEHRYVGLNAINQKVIIQRVPNYTSVTINSGGTLTATAYDGLATVPTGGAGYRTGIVAFRAIGTVTVNTGGTISVTSLGYRGGTAGASGANGGFNGESYNATGTNVSGRGGNGASNGETWGGGRSSNGAVAATNNGIARGGGGGGGSNGSASTGDDGSGAGGGGGYGGGGGGGGGGSNAVASNGGTGGAGGSTDVAGGGGAGAQNTVAAGVNGGNAGSAGTAATGAGGAVGNGMVTGAGGSGAAVTTGGGAGGGGGGLYGDTQLENFFYGGGGGGGAGGFSTNTAGTAGANGGGIIFIAADTISLPGTGTIQSNGGAGTNGTAPASGGGGGAGGSIRLEAVTSLSLGSSLVQATGGAAGTAAARRGGSAAGGVGRIYTEYIGSTSGTTSPAATVAQVTNNYGTLYVGSINTVEADLAEYYITGDNTIEAGDVVSISPYTVATDNNEVLANQGVLRKTDKAYDSKLVGIISTAPGLTLGSKDSNGNMDNRALALKGRVPVKIDPNSDPISIGDYLTSSVKPGYAKKATEPGYTLGKALEYWNPSLGKETINVFVDLGYYYGGNSTNQEALALSNRAGLSISGYDIPSRVVNIISSATESNGQVLGATSDSNVNQGDEEVQSETATLERQIQLALGSSELSDYYGTSDSSITTGDVVKFDDNQNLTKTFERGDANVIGVAATQPNILLNGLIKDESNRTISMGGKVILKVTDTNGPIKKGDYLAPSSIPGYAQKADNANGIVLGRAIEDFPLSLSADSSMVKKELAKNKTEAISIIDGLIRNGNFTPGDATKYKELLDQYFAESLVDNVDGFATGRIVAYVNIGYITEGMMLPRNANVAQGTVPGSNGNQENVSDLADIIEKLQNTQLTLNNVLTVKNVIEAQTYQNITGLDLAFKISSASNSFKVLDINDESLLQIDQNGKLTLKEGENSSIGEVLFPAQTNELFIDNTSVTENSKIYLTPNEFVFSKVRAINPGVGFTIQLQNVMEKEVEVSYLIIN